MPNDLMARVKGSGARIVYKRTVELWRVIGDDVEESAKYNDLKGVLLAGFICRRVFSPPFFIADTILLPYDLIKWFFVKDDKDIKSTST